jgi:hypothetical protein
MTTDPNSALEPALPTAAKCNFVRHDVKSVVSRAGLMKLTPAK